MKTKEQMLEALELAAETDGSEYGDCLQYFLFLFNGYGMFSDEFNKALNDEIENLYLNLTDFASMVKTNAHTVVKEYKVPESTDLVFDIDEDDLDENQEIIPWE